MNGVLNQSRLYFRHWQLFLWSFFAPVTVCLPMIIAAAKTGEMHLGLTLLAVFGLVCGTGFFLASAQQELMCRSFSFLLPGLRNGMSLVHLTAGLILFTLVLLSVLLLPPFAQTSNATISVAWATASLMALCYGLTVLFVFSTPYSSWAPLNVLFLLFLIIKFLTKPDPEQILSFLDHPLILTPLTIGVAWLVHARLKSPALHRRLIEQPYISIADLKNQAKIQEFKQARIRHKDEIEDECRPGIDLIRSVTARAHQSMMRGPRSRALSLEALATGLMTSIPRRKFWVLLLVLFLPVMVIYTAYLDGYFAAKPGDNDLLGWFPGFAFMIMYFPALLFHYVKTRPLGLLRGRSDMYQAGFHSVAMTLLWALLGSALVWGLFQVSAWWLPEVTFRNCQVQTLMPPAHAPFLPLFFLPWALLIHTLWRQKSTIMVLQQSSTLLFFVFHGLLLFGGKTLLWPTIGLAAAAWLAWPFVWHWRVFKTDH